MCEGFRTLGFRKEIDCFTMPAVYTRARMQMCHLKTKTFESLSLDFPEMDVPFMFLGGTVTKAKGDYNPNRYYEKICMLYMHKYANIYIYMIYLYIFIFVISPISVLFITFHLRCLNTFFQSNFNPPRPTHLHHEIKAGHDQA